MDLDLAALWLPEIVRIARAAGDAVMEIYATDFVVRGKTDTSPVTDADEHAEACILPALAKLAPGVPAVSEEAVCAGHMPAFKDRFWLIDPLDGTREFIQRNGEFTVNIALIEHGRPILGVVLAPALKRLFAGAQGLGAYREDQAGRHRIACRAIPAAGMDVVASRSHGDAEALDIFLAGHRVNSLKSAGSSLKLCLVASGEADLYPRLGRTMEWDIAAGHAVLAAAGGQVWTLDHQKLGYGKPDFANPHFFACSAAASRRLQR